MTLKETYADIRAEIKKRLTESAKLTEIQRVVYGEKVRYGTLATPAIWIVPEPYTPELTGGHAVNHNIRYNFVVLVKSDQPEAGLENAEDLALIVYDELISDRTLGKRVYDIRPAGVDPAYEMGSDSNIYYAAVTFDFVIRRDE